MSLTSILQKMVNLVIKIKITEHIVKLLGEKRSPSEQDKHEK